MQLTANSCYVACKQATRWPATLLHDRSARLLSAASASGDGISDLVGGVVRDASQELLEPRQQVDPTLCAVIMTTPFAVFRSVHVDLDTHDRDMRLASVDVARSSWDRGQRAALHRDGWSHRSGIQQLQLPGDRQLPALQLRTELQLVAYPGHLIKNLRRGRCR